MVVKLGMERSLPSHELAMLGGSPGGVWLSQSMIQLNFGMHLQLDLCHLGQ